FTSGDTASVAENAATSTVIYTAAATDADATFGDISYTLGGADAAAFTLDAVTGELTLNASADYEAKASYDIVITATQGSTSTDQAVTISVIDVNDNAPVFSSGDAASVAENADASTVIYTAAATDADATFGPISYTLGGADAAAFTLDAVTGELRLNASADYEARASYDIVITAKQGSTSTDQAVTISVIDVNDNAPLFTSGDTASVAENADASTVIYTAAATDADATFGDISYTLGGADAAAFTLDAVTGELRLNASADYEARASYDIVITATQGVTSTDQAVSISVIDVNDNAPVFTSGDAASVAENADASTVIYTAAATDADATFGPISYTLGGADAAAFTLDAATGELTLNASADYEAKASYDIVITATQGVTSTDQAVSISVIDVNDNAPVFTSGDAASVAENADASTVIYTAAATDADATFGPISYTLGGADKDAFTLDAATGELTLNASADYEAKASYDIVITATQGVTSTDQAVSISVI
ncbi:cadherin repeat domain-containing protein, partial [Sphingobium sp. sgz301303]|uniref:cadherin repeat domain-containing protein n=2 Tax=unclassified Sphingobium TaxID=2611147 RepID=UPI0035B998A2